MGRVEPLAPSEEDSSASASINWEGATEVREIILVYAQAPSLPVPLSALSHPQTRPCTASTDNAWPSPRPSGAWGLGCDEGLMGSAS